MEPTQRQLEILHHTLGVRPDQRESYRNYYVAGPGHHSMADLEALEQAGMMMRTRTPAFCDKRDIVFSCTEAGTAYALEHLPMPPVLPKNKSKYQGYCEYSECYDNFAHFLGINKPKYETDQSTIWDSKRGHRRKYSHRMVRYGHGIHIDIQGEWMPTKKAAKASYKASLAKSKGGAQ